MRIADFKINGIYGFEVEYLYATSYGNYLSLKNPFQDCEWTKSLKVKAFEFQTQNEQALIGTTISCIYTGIDRMTGRPTLVQDKGDILRVLYKDNEMYSFLVDDYATDINTDAPFLVLKDDLCGRL